MSVVLITAISANNVIGVNNELPWKLKEDMKFFKEKTTGNVVIMGRKTYEGIGQPLPKRFNIVVSSQDIPLDFPHLSVKTPWQAYDLALKFQKKTFVIGGESVYRYFLANGLIDEAYITYVHQAICGDNLTYFPIEQFQFRRFSCQIIGGSSDEFPHTTICHFKRIT